MQEKTTDVNSLRFLEPIEWSTDITSPLRHGSYSKDFAKNGSEYRMTDCYVRVVGTNELICRKVDRPSIQIDTQLPTLGQSDVTIHHLHTCTEVHWLAQHIV